MADRRILVVEDNAIIAMETVERLKRMGYTVCGIAATGADAVRLAESGEPDLVLMDINLRGDMDGVEAARTIVEARAVPVIYLTAYSDDETLARAKVIQPFRYLVKPYKERDLYTCIHGALSTMPPGPQPGIPEDMLRFVENLETCEDALVVAGPRGDLQYINRKAAELTGWTAEALAGKSLDSILEFKSSERDRNAFRDPRPCQLLGSDGRKKPARALVIRPGGGDPSAGMALALFWPVERRRT